MNSSDCHIITFYWHKGNGNECGVRSLSLLLLDTTSVDSYTIIHFYSQKSQKDKAVSWLHVLGHGLVLRHGQTSGIYSCLSHSFTSPFCSSFHFCKQQQLCLYLPPLSSPLNFNQKVRVKFKIYLSLHCFCFLKVIFIYCIFNTSIILPVCT